MRRLFLLLLCAATFRLAPAHAGPTSDTDGGVQANKAVLSVLTSPEKAKIIVPEYTEHPAELDYNGTDLHAAAQNRLAQCTSQPALPGCASVLAVQQSAAAPRRDMSDVAASIAGARNIARNPGGTLGSLSAYYSGCSETGVCSNDVFCLGPQCFDTSSVADPDFAEAMTYLEGARQAGVYLDPGRSMDQSTMRIFAGEDNRCENGLFVNCCKSNADGKNMSNGQMTGVGSKLVFDLLMNSANQRFLMQGMQSLVTGAELSGTASLSGVTLTVNPVIADPYHTILTQTDGVFVTVDPTTLAISVVVMVALEMAQCSQEEMKTGLKEGARLCHTVDNNRCKKRVLGFCVKRETVKCCYNSVLARVINEQGRAQLHIGWGSGDRPACNGFSFSELSRLDFSTMDLSEFYASIKPDNPNNSSFQTGAQTSAPQCYDGHGNCNATQSPLPVDPPPGQPVPGR